MNGPSLLNAFLPPLTVVILPGPVRIPTANGDRAIKHKNAAKTTAFDGIIRTRTRTRLASSSASVKKDLSFVLESANELALCKKDFKNVPLSLHRDGEIRKEEHEEEERLVINEMSTLDSHDLLSLFRRLKCTLCLERVKQQLGLVVKEKVCSKIRFSARLGGMVINRTVLCYTVFYTNIYSLKFKRTITFTLELYSLHKYPTDFNH